MNGSRRRFLGGALAAGGAALARVSPVHALARRKQKTDAPLFQDDFTRPDRSGWGPRWFNQRYGRNWDIVSKRGIFRMPATEHNIRYRPMPVLVLDHDVANIDLRATLSLSNRSSKAGLVGRAVGYADYYAVRLGPSGLLEIMRCGHHSEVRLAKKKIDHSVDRRYRIRMQIRDTGPVRIRAKVWPAGTPEPLRWRLEAIDASPNAIAAKGAFGLFFHHAADRRAASFRVVDVVARSAERPSDTAPALAYALAGPPSNGKVTVVAKSAVPARIAFEVAPEPTFTQGVVTLRAKATNRAGTVKNRIDLAPYGASTPVYWRPIAQRGNNRVVGPTSSFRTEPTPGLPVRFAFGSCTRWQASPRRSFDHARLKLPDLYLHQGDFGYVPTRVAATAPDTYQDHWVRMCMDPSFAAMTREVPFSWMRDDADYGWNRADSNTLLRFTIGAHDQLNANPGPYYETRYGDVAIFNVDCRRFSTGKGLPPGSRSKLGAAQKTWLKESMAAAASEQMGLLVLSSPQAFGSDASRESWRNGYEQEWNELIDFFQTLGTAVLIVSGDAHGHRLHEYPQKNLQANVPRIVEIVSSGTEQKKFFDDIDPQFLLKKAKGSGFGLVELGAEENVGGQSTRSLTLTAIKTADGTPFWTANYVIVKGLGILPIVGA